MSNNLANVTVAVTGAGGLVGGHLVEYLAARGANVLAVVRQSGKEQLTRFARKYEGPGKVSVRVADLRDDRAARRALDGAEVIVHAAGRVDPYGSAKEIFDTNVGGTKSVIIAAKEIKAKQLIFISSLSVITGQGDQYDVDESAPLRRCGENYADSKVMAEELVMAARGDLNVTALRPGFIYGPGETAWLPRLINSIKTGKAMLIDGGSKETNVIYVENLSRAIAAAILNDRAFGQVYNLTDGQKVSKKELFDAIADNLKLPRVTKRVPGALARMVSEVVSTVAPVLPVATRKSLARYSRAAFRLAGVNQGFSIGKAERDLGYTEQVRVPFAEGMARTLVTFQPGYVKPQLYASDSQHQMPAQAAEQGAQAETRSQ